MGSGLSRRKLDLLLALAVALLLAAPAAASPLDDAKQAGHLGEQADGYVGVRSDAPESAHELAGRRIDDDVVLIFEFELPKLHEDGAAVAREWRMR